MNPRIATRLIPDAAGRLHRVPAHVGAPPRQRGGLGDWLSSRRAVPPVAPAGARPSHIATAGTGGDNGSLSDAE